MERGELGPAIESPWELIKTLLAPRTMPHVFLLIAGTGGLFALVSTVNEDPGFAAIIFTSAMASYIIIGIIGNNSHVKKWLLIEGFSSKIGKIIGPILLPIFFMILIAGTILLTIAQDKAIRDTWAIVLSSLFVFWSIGQGLALRSSIRGIFIGAKSSKREEKSEPKPWDFRILFIGAFVSSLTIALMRGVLIPNFTGNNPEILLWMIYVIVSFSITGLFLQMSKDGFIPYDLSWTKGDRSRVHRIGQLMILLIAWHLSSAWSRLSGEGNNLMLLEEAILVIITVVSAVWAMTNRNKNSIGFVSKDTAIHWAIAFGFGYAGSITVMSGLTDSLPFLGDISQTLGAGHILTAFTLLLGIKTTISRPSISEIITKEEGNKNLEIDELSNELDEI